MICTICAQDKPLSEFPLNRRAAKHADGRSRRPGARQNVCKIG